MYENKEMGNSHCGNGYHRSAVVHRHYPKANCKNLRNRLVNHRFPEMQLECVNVEYADVYGDYLITFNGPNENTYSCVIGPKYFPVSMGQGLLAIESDYAENYE